MMNKFGRELLFITISALILPGVQAEEIITEPFFDLPITGFDVVELAGEFSATGWTTFQDDPAEFGGYRDEGVGGEMLVYRFDDDRLLSVFYSYDLYVRGQSEIHQVRRRSQAVFDHLEALWGFGDGWEDGYHNYYRTWPEESPDSLVSVYQETEERGQRLEVELHFDEPRLDD